MCRCGIVITRLYTNGEDAFPPCKLEVSGDTLEKSCSVYIRSSTQAMSSGFWFLLASRSARQDEGGVKDIPGISHSFVQHPYGDPKEPFSTYGTTDTSSRNRFVSGSSFYELLVHIFGSASHVEKLAFASVADSRQKTSLPDLLAIST